MSLNSASMEKSRVAEEKESAVVSFARWCWTLELELKREGLWMVTTQGVDTAAQWILDEDEDCSKESAQEGDIVAARKKARRLDRKARAHIGMSVKSLRSGYDELINGCATASEMWHVLKVACTAEAARRKIENMVTLKTIRMEEGGNVSKHVATFMGIVDELKAANVKESDTTLAWLLLKSLPSEWDDVAMPLRKQIPSLNITDVIKALLTAPKRKATQAQTAIQQDETDAGRHAPQVSSTHEAKTNVEATQKQDHELRCETQEGMHASDRQSAHEDKEVQVVQSPTLQGMRPGDDGDQETLSDQDDKPGGVELKQRDSSRPHADPAAQDGEESQAPETGVDAEHLCGRQEKPEYDDEAAGGGADDTDVAIDALRQPEKVNPAEAGRSCEEQHQPEQQEKGHGKLEPPEEHRLRDKSDKSDAKRKEEWPRGIGLKPPVDDARLIENPGGKKDTSDAAASSYVLQGIGAGEGHEDARRSSEEVSTEQEGDEQYQTQAQEQRPESHTVGETTKQGTWSKPYQVRACKQQKQTRSEETMSGVTSHKGTPNRTLPAKGEQRQHNDKRPAKDWRTRKKEELRGEQHNQNRILPKQRDGDLQVSRAAGKIGSLRLKGECWRSASIHLPRIMCRGCACHSKYYAGTSQRMDQHGLNQEFGLAALNPFQKALDVRDILDVLF